MYEYNSRMTEKFPGFVKFSKFFDRFFHSPYYLFSLLLISTFGFVFNAEIISIALLLLYVSLNLVSCRDIAPSFVAAVLISLVPMQYANTPLDGFSVFIYAPIVFVPAIVLRFVFFPFKFVKGKNLIPLIVYSVVLILGGLGSEITAREYFAFYPLYTMLGLGVLQTLMYMFWQSYIPDNPDKTVIYFCKMMCTIAVASMVMIVATYIKYFINHPEVPFKFVFFPWKNYISDILMLTMPFAFFLAVKSNFKITGIAFGLLQYLCIIFTQSGGGILFSTLMMPILIVYTLLKIEKTQRITVIIFLSALIICILAFLLYKKDVFIALYKRKLETGGSNRLTLYKIAIEEFKKYPVFGVGFGFVHEFMIKSGFIMTYFHSTFFQALGATGIVGVLGYAYMAFCRLKTYVRKNVFNIFLVIGFLGYAGYSMVDVGTVMPFPFAMMCTFMLVITEKYNAYHDTPVPKNKSHLRIFFKSRCKETIS